MDYCNICKDCCMLVDKNDMWFCEYEMKYCETLHTCSFNDGDNPETIEIAHNKKIYSFYKPQYFCKLIDVIDVKGLTLILGVIENEKTEKIHSILWNINGSVYTGLTDYNLIVNKG